MSTIPVYKILDLLADGLSVEEIIKQKPVLTGEDIYSALRSAARTLKALDTQNPKPKTQNPLLIYTDGSSKGNPGPAGAGVIIYKGKAVIDRISQPLGKATNNIAEYKGVILGLKRAKEMKAKKVSVFSDSELLVKQMNGHYRIKDKNLVALSLEVNQLRREFESITISYIPREKNKEANLLADQAATVGKW